MPALATVPSTAATPFRDLDSGPAGKVFTYRRRDYLVSSPTLRAKADRGAEYMPESRARLARKARRNVAADVQAQGESAALWPVHDDGLGAWIVRARPGEAVVSPASDGARYYLIVGGSAALDATTPPRWSCVWKAGNAAHPALTAGPDGADIVVVQFPEEDTR